MGRTEMMLKTVMSPIENVPAFVDHIFRLIPDCDVNEFIKILDMKGFKRTEQGPLVELFRNKIPAGAAGATNDPVEPDSPETNVESSRIKKLEKLIKKRL